MKTDLTAEDIRWMRVTRALAKSLEIAVERLEASCPDCGTATAMAIEQSKKALQRYNELCQ